MEIVPFLKIIQAFNVNHNLNGTDVCCFTHPQHAKESNMKTSVIEKCFI